MYQDEKKRKSWILLLLVFLAAMLLLWQFALKGSAGKDVEEESVLSIKKAVEQCALQCYVVEGAYPVNLQYLIDNYGLRINMEEFHVVYDAFAGNQIPEIRVVRK